MTKWINFSWKVLDGKTNFLTSVCLKKVDLNIGFVHSLKTLITSNENNNVVNASYIITAKGNHKQFET